MRKFFLASTLLFLAACNQAPQCPEPAATPVSPPPAAAAAAPAEPAPAEDGAPRALKSPLPEGFELPFAYHRLYDNTGRTEAGTPQRRVMVEFIGSDATDVEGALGAALEAKGFVERGREQADGEELLRYERDDGAEVIVRIDAQPARVRTEDARGTLHLTWNSA